MRSQVGSLRYLTRRLWTVSLVTVLMCACSAPVAPSPTPAAARESTGYSPSPRDTARPSPRVAEPARTSRPPYAPTEPVLVTHDDTALSAGCRPSDAAGLIQRFLGAVNNRDSTGIDETWSLPASSSGEQWYSITEGDPGSGGRHFVARTRSELLAYFDERFDAGENMRLVMADVGPSRSGRAAIGFVLSRHADDVDPSLGGPNRLAQGKADMDCQRQVLFVWSMAQVVGVVEPRLCDAPPDWTPAEGPIACARTAAARNPRQAPSGDIPAH